MHAHPHGTLHHCLGIQGLCGLPGRIQLQLGQGETGLKSPSAAQTPAAARLGVGCAVCAPASCCWAVGFSAGCVGQRWGGDEGGCTLWVVAGSSAHAEFMGIFFFFFLAFCAVNKVSVKMKAATLAPSVTHTSFLTRFATAQFLHVNACGHCIPMTLLPVANSWQSSMALFGSETA